jgi:hypothetical protein
MAVSVLVIKPREGIAGLTELVFAASLKIITVGSPDSTQFMHCYGVLEIESFLPTVFLAPEQTP